jgi:hypothetical protein
MAETTDMARQNAEARKAKTDAAKEQLGDAKKLRAEQDKQRAEAAKGKPTPTQEENDLIKLGAAPDELEDDGSPPDPNNFSKAVEARKPGGAGYQTRQAEPAKK